MTERLYWQDPYMKEFEAEVEDINENGVVLNRTAFYPTGGGQPNDTGTIECNGTVYNVVDVSKNGDIIMHKLDKTEGISKGNKIIGRINWERRYAHMKYHTALHIIDGVVYKKYKGGITGGQIYADRARMDFDMAIDKETVEKIISEAQKVVDENHDVVAKVLSKEEAMNIEGLSRTDPGTELLAKLDSIRVIDIVGFDMQLDGGTHVSKTKEVGKIMLAKYENKGSHNKRITITLE